jgi:FkbM family methyltransferase
MSLLHRARRLFQAIGLDVRRFPQGEPAYRRVQLILHHRIDHVFDVGASDGRYGEELRRFGYQGRIVSFEPLRDSFGVLSDRVATDPLWTALPYALGSHVGEVVLNVAGNVGASSSILPMLERHRATAPDAAYIATQKVAQYPLDRLWRDFAGPQDRTFCKIDVQGYERHVLDGAAEFLNHCLGLQLELSLVPLYEGAMPYREALDVIEGLGFALMAIDAGFTDSESGQALQVDAVFFRVEGSAFH